MFGKESSNDIDISMLGDKKSVIFNFLNDNFRDRDQYIGELLKKIYLDENGNELNDSKNKYDDLNYITNFYNLFEKVSQDFIYSQIRDKKYSNEGSHIEYTKSKIIGHKIKNDLNPMIIDSFFKFDKNKIDTELKDNLKEHKYIKLRNIDSTGTILEGFFQIYPVVGSNVSKKAEIEKNFDKTFGRLYSLDINFQVLLNWKIGKLGDVLLKEIINEFRIVLNNIIDNDLKIKASYKTDSCLDYKKEHFFFIVDSKFKIKADNNDIYKQFMYYSIFSIISNTINDTNSFHNIFISPM